MSTFEPHLAEQFEIDGQLVFAQPFGNGNINDTFPGTYREGDGLRRYIHQRINSRVFPNPDTLMENAERITRHLRERMEAEGRDDIHRFLTDYLQGDTYFKIRRPNHNLDRARAQFALAASIEAQQETMERCVSTVWRNDE